MEIEVFDQQYIREHIDLNEIYKPVTDLVLVLHQGELTLELNGSRLRVQEKQLLYITTANIYKIVHLSQDFAGKILKFNREKLDSKLTLDINRYEIYQIIRSNRARTLLCTAEDFNVIWNLIISLETKFNIPLEQQGNFHKKAVYAIFESISYCFVDLLFTHAKGQNIAVNKRQEGIAISFLNLVAKHFKTERSLAFYADKMHISIKYMSICVKEITQSAPSHILSDAVVLEAKIQLLTSTKTINQIALDLHFSDQYSFGKFFKKHSQYNPSAFRKINRENIPIEPH